MFDKHRSTENQYNASWILTINEDLNYGSATDGDFDIAYSLLLANKSWGSNGEINYLQHAKNTIQFGLKVNDISQSYRPTLGDWASRSSFDTRSSDFMPDHFRAYKLATNDNFWDNPVNTVYDVISKIQSQFSSKTGLVPDFIIGSDPRPATNNYLDEATVDFSWNACRLPLRLAIDYGLYGSNEAKVSLTKIMQWVIKDTGGDPSKIKSGYFLDGQPQVNETSAAFISPIVAAASIDSTYQRFLNDGWDYMVKTKESYYADTITLLSLLYLSGVWQRPN
jgi:endo-1,4-beta-D-glucanase Y